MYILLFSCTLWKVNFMIWNVKLLVNKLFIVLRWAILTVLVSLNVKQAFSVSLY